jgi:hypothetical protein
MTSTTAPWTEDLELGHPVRSFVLVLVGLGLILLGVQWTGLVHPDVHAMGSGVADLGDGAQTFTVAVQNSSFLPVQILEVDWPVSHVTSSEVGIAPSSTSPDGATVSYLLRPFEPFTLDGGQTAWIGIRVVPECDARLGEPTVRVRTASGLERRIGLDQPGEAVQGGCA